MISFNLDGRKVSIDIEPNELLLNVLRDRLGVNVPKYSCGIGECGACTVLIDGEPHLSCLTLAVDVNGKDVRTASGLDEKDLSIISKTFAEEGAVQCGYCSPGIAVMTYSLLQEKEKVSEDEVREYLRGNLCRCTGYVNIVRAVLKAAEMRGKK
ncbi:MAG: (2Fe-2S)-binding protein [Fervidicoccaceae archaeon]